MIGCALTAITVFLLCIASVIGIFLWLCALAPEPPNDEGGTTYG